MTQKRKRTDLTEAYTGSRRRSARKTEASRVNCGSKHPAILETGVTTVKRVSAFNTIRMATNTKACGLLIKDTDKELTGGLKPVNLDVSIQVIGMRTKSMVEALSFTKMETDTMATGSMAYLKVKVV